MVDVMRSEYKNLRVLVADDDRNIVNLLCRLLRELGFGTIESADSGISAAQKLEEAGFDLIIADWMMEPMSGIELIERLRTDERWASLPFIMVTGKNDQQGVETAKTAGVSGYLLKPFRIADLQKQVEHALQSASAPASELRA
jgi:two-component system, chemotaxis family, chemotaxis protein CheY